MIKAIATNPVASVTGQDFWRKAQYVTNTFVYSFVFFQENKLQIF